MSASKLPDAHSKCRGGIVGKSGTGKSNSAKLWLARQLERRTRAAVFDPFNEYSQQGRASEHVRLGPLRQMMTLEALDHDPRVLDRDDLALSVVPTSNDPDVQAEEFRAFVDHCLATGDLLCCADEFGRYGFENAKAHVAVKACNELLTTGRHAGVGALLVSQRLVHIPKTARAQLVAVECFLQTDPDDLDALAKLAAKHGEPDWELAAEVAELSEGESRVWLDPMAVAKERR